MTLLPLARVFRSVIRIKFFLSSLSFNLILRTLIDFLRNALDYFPQGKLFYSEDHSRLFCLHFAALSYLSWT